MGLGVANWRKRDPDEREVIVDWADKMIEDWTYPQRLDPMTQKRLWQAAQRSFNYASSLPRVISTSHETRDPTDCINAVTAPSILSALNQAPFCFNV